MIKKAKRDVYIVTSVSILFILCFGVFSYAQYHIYGVDNLINFWVSRICVSLLALAYALTRIKEIELDHKYKVVFSSLKDSNAALIKKCTTINKMLEHNEEIEKLNDFLLGKTDEGMIPKTPEDFMKQLEKPVCDHDAVDKLIIQKMANEYPYEDIIGTEFTFSRHGSKWKCIITGKLRREGNVTEVVGKIIKHQADDWMKISGSVNRTVYFPPEEVIKEYISEQLAANQSS